MSATVQQLEQEIQNELTTSNQLLTLIALELHQIKQLTKPGGEFEENIIKNRAINEALANIQELDLEKLHPITRNQMEHRNTSQENSYLNNTQ